MRGLLFYLKIQQPENRVEYFKIGLKICIAFLSGLLQLKLGRPISHYTLRIY